MLKLHCLILLCVMILTQAYGAVIKNGLENEREAQILTKEYTIDDNGNYNFSYETSNGINRSETGTVINKGQPNEHVAVEGRYSYINAKGEEQIFRFVADENGYRVLPLPRIVLLAVFAIFALTTAAPLDKDSEATITKNEFTIDGKGSYKFSYETSNGLTRWEEGTIENEGQPNEHIIVNGYYIYYDPDGKKQMAQYSGDENGFHILPEVSEVEALPPNVVASLLGR